MPKRSKARIQARTDATVTALQDWRRLSLHERAQLGEHNQSEPPNRHAHALMRDDMLEVNGSDGPIGYRFQFRLTPWGRFVQQVGRKADSDGLYDAETGAEMIPFVSLNHVQMVSIIARGTPDGHTLRFARRLGIVDEGAKELNALGLELRAEMKAARMLK